MGPRTCVLVAGGGAGWEAAAVPAMAAAGAVVLKRCVDVPDLLATARAGQADVALVAAGLPGLDADAVVRLLRDDVRTVAVAAGDDRADAERLARIGVVATVPPEVGAIVDGVLAAPDDPVVPDPEPVDTLPPSGTTGRVVAVWGPTGAPGRTTVAVGLAAQRARTGPVVLVDADQYGGAVAQHLGVLDEVSGLLAAARLANAGNLDAVALAGCRRRVADRLDVLTGLPRADRWIEVRAGVLPAVLRRSAEVGDVVVDCGFGVEEDSDPLRGAGRDTLARDALGEADEVVVVGSAEPTGLARLARALVDLAEVAPGTPVRVVVNRMRDTLGWSRRDITGMVEGYVRPLGVHFLPEDRPAVDRALVAGRSLVESGDSALARALAEVAAAAYPAPVRTSSAQAAPKSR